MYASKESRFSSFYSVKMTFLNFSCFFKIAWFWIENFIACQILSWKKNNASGFELKEKEHARVWNEFFFAWSDLNKKLYNVIDF